MTRRFRQLLLLTHLAVAFGWLASSLAMLALIGHGTALADPGRRRAVFGVAAFLDDNVLADFSFMTVYTGLMLAGLTPWGYLRFWWVAVKLVVAVGCALTGRELFGRWWAEASTAGQSAPDGRLLAATAFMAATLAVLAWIGRTKPWGQTGLGPPVRPLDHPVLWVAVLVTPVLDYATGWPLQAVPAAVVLGHRGWATVRGWRRSPATG